jgi:hypothetical protein
VRETVAVELVGDEQAEHGDTGGVGSQLLAQEKDDEHAFDKPVAEQVEGAEMLL